MYLIYYISTLQRATLRKYIWHHYTSFSTAKILLFQKICKQKPIPLAKSNDPRETRDKFTMSPLAICAYG